MTASIHLGTGAGPDTLPPLTAAEARRQQDVPLASRAAGSRAVDWSLAAFCIAAAARHDGIVRGVFVLGRLVPSYRLHQLAYHLGQLHRAMAIAGMAWLAVAAVLAVPSSPGVGIASAGVLAILAVMACTAGDRVRQSQHNRFESVHRFGGWAALGILAVIVPAGAARSLPPGSARRRVSRGVS